MSDTQRSLYGNFSPTPMHMQFRAALLATQLLVGSANAYAVTDDVDALSEGQLRINAVPAGLRVWGNALLDPNAQVFAFDTLGNRRQPLDLKERLVNPAALYWWGHHLLNPKSPWDRAAINLTVGRVMEQLRLAGPQSIALHDLPTTGLSPLHLLAVLTVTSSWKSQVPGWQEAFALATNLIRRAGMSPDLLRGLE